MLEPVGFGCLCPLAGPGHEAVTAGTELRNLLMGEAEMSAENIALVGKRWTAAELRKLPAAQRDAIFGER